MKCVLLLALVACSTAFVVNRSGYEEAPPADDAPAPSSDGGDQQGYNSDGAQNDAGGVLGVASGLINVLSGNAVKVPVQVNPQLCGNNVGGIFGGVANQQGNKIECESENKNSDAPADGGNGYGKKKLH